MGIMSGKHFIYFNASSILSILAIAAIMMHLTGDPAAAYGPLGVISFVLFIDLMMIHRAGNLRRLFGYALVPFAAKNTVPTDSAMAPDKTWRDPRDAGRK